MPTAVVCGCLIRDILISTLRVVEWLQRAGMHARELAARDPQTASAPYQMI